MGSDEEGTLPALKQHRQTNAALANSRAADDQDRAQAPFEDLGSRSLPFRWNVKLASRITGQRLSPDTVLRWELVLFSR
jgi:hypothetical protein